MSVVLGAIADDFTGATDLANTLANRSVGPGMKTVLLTGLPPAGFRFDDVDAIVVALKSRTVPVDQAIQASLAVLDWLQSLNVHQVFFKYCSTFDSTAKGNIGPVADALQQRLGDEISIVCPAFPATGRTVLHGDLYVNNVLLSESSMKDHPLTPMTDSNLVRLMEMQSRHDVGLVNHDIVKTGVDAIKLRFQALTEVGEKYAVMDVMTDSDLKTIGESVSEHKLITGGSGVAMGLPDNYRRQGLLAGFSEIEMPVSCKRAVVLSGSCSTATRKQISYVKDRWPSFKLKIEDIENIDVVEQVIKWFEQQNPDIPALIYASADPEEVVFNQEKYGRLVSGEMFEKTFTDIASNLVNKDVSTLIVAGGETSGAVISGLNIQSLRIGPEIAPGVPWTETLDKPGLAIALKSGNFGGEDFFFRAIQMLNG